MPAVFPPVSNLIARASVLALLTGAIAATALAVGASGSAYDSGFTLGAWQPVPFSHEHHAGDLGIDCRYCHSSVDTAAYAGMPSTEVCINCHAQIWPDAQVLQPVRDSWQHGTRLHWTRVYELPDFVYFDHSVHVTAGVSCEVCHGAVDRMPLVFEAVQHTMQWCLDCHRDPWPRIGTRPLLTAGSAASGAAVAGTTAGPREVRTGGLTSCSTCHR